MMGPTAGKVNTYVLSRKHAYIILNPLNPTLYSKTEVYRGINYFFAEVVLMSTHNLCFEQKYENIRAFYLKNFQFLEVKFSLYLNMRVFVM